MTLNIKLAGALTLLSAASLSVQAAPLMPDFANVPTGWVTDRFEPDSFSNVGTYQGRSNVLGIGISSADNLANRPSGFQTSFYNTQGRQHAVSGGAGSSLGSDLFVEQGWRDATNGNVRSDMWGVATDGNLVPTLMYPIIGFTNYGGAPRYRVYDAESAGGWVDLLTAVNFGGWTAFDIVFDGTSFEYTINGVSVYTDITIGNTTGFSAVIMQAYNFGDPAFLPGAVVADYVANWSNARVAEVPEPTSLALVAVALAGLALARRRKG